MFISLINKMVVYSDNVLEGNLDKYGDIVRKMVNLKKSKKFMIGGTHSIDERLTYHTDNNKMESMYILYKTDNYNRATKMEQKLQLRFSKIKNYINDENQNGGSLEEGHGEYFMYILFK